MSEVRHVIHQTLRPGPGDVLKHLEGRGGRGLLAQALAQLGDRGLKQHGRVLSHQPEQVEQHHVLCVRALHEERHQGHHVVVDQLLVHGVDSGKDPGQAAVAGDDTVEDGLDVARQDVSILDDISHTDLHQRLVVVTCQKLRLVGNFLKYIIN